MHHKMELFLHEHGRGTGGDLQSDKTHKRIKLIASRKKHQEKEPGDVERKKERTRPFSQGCSCSGQCRESHSLMNANIMTRRSGL